MPTNAGWATGEPVASADINTYLLRGSRNVLINGDMKINQRGVTSATDDIYTLDRWTLLSDAATITVARSTVAPDDGLYSFSLTPSTTNKKFGIAQYVEQQNCVGLFGQQVTLSFKARVNSISNLDNVKAAIVAWTGTADSVTSDVVSTWNAEGTNPTLASNWTYENTPANLGVTTSWATYRITATVDTVACKQVAVFIWSDVTTVSAADTLYITDVQLERGAIATPFDRRTVGEELALCQRYYWRTTATSTGFERIPALMNTYISGAHGHVFHPVPMRAKAHTIEQQNTGITDNISYTSGAATWGINDTLSNNRTTWIGQNGLSGLPAANIWGQSLCTRGTIGDFIGFSAEL